MVGLAYDCLANPLGAVRLTFEKAIASGADPASFSGRDWGALDVFRNFLFDQDGLSQVPILDHKTVKWIQPNTLVRFRGMIQDMLGNEVYVGAYKDGTVWRTNKYLDISQVPMDSSADMRIWERRLLYCVPVPGLNSWAEPSSEATMKKNMELASQQGEKRRRGDDEIVDDMDLAVSNDEFESFPSAKKMREDGHPSHSTLSPESISQGACSSASCQTNINRDFLPCLVKIYDNPESDLKLNEVFEFIGVLTFDSQPQVDKDDLDDFENSFMGDTLTPLPPSNEVPHLHCFIHRKLAIHDFLQCSTILEPKPYMVKEIRETLLRYLTDVLGNDGLASHFVLLHLLSKVHLRTETLAVGKLSLNLTGLSKESVSVFGTQLSLAIKNLLPFSDYLPLTIGYLNATPFSPKKDYETNRLITGCLQLAEGTHLIIDETTMGEGNLFSVGVDNTRLLKNLTELQKVEYDFKYYKMEMTADIQLLVLSEGKSCFCPADLVVPFQPTSVGSSEGSADAVDAWRWYLAMLRSLPHSIDAEIQEAIANDLAEARRVDRNLGTEDFSRLLTMGRLMCMSYGETSLSLEHWQMVKELERLRRERLK